MKPICSNTYRGFTLIEVLVTVVVLALALLALSKFQGDSLKEGSLSKQRTEATNIAQSQIEQLRNFTNFATVATTAAAPVPDIVGSNATFSVSRTVTAVGANLAQVQVTVTWKDAKGQITPNTTITLASAISNVSPVATAQAAGTPAAPIAVPPAAPIVVPPPVTGTTTTTTTTTGTTDTTSTTSGTTSTTSGTTSTTSGTTGTTSGTSGIPSTASCTFYFTNNPNTFTVTQSEPIDSALCTTSCVSAKILYPKNKESYTVTCP